MSNRRLCVKYRKSLIRSDHRGWGKREEKTYVTMLCERWDLVLKNRAFRHQIDVFKRSGIRPQFANADQQERVLLSTVWPRPPEALEIVNADIVKRWRHQGFRHYLLGKRRRPERPAIEPKIRSLIQRMRRQNMLWGAPQIHGEFLKLGLDVCQTMAAKYIVRHVGPPSQRWGTFLRDHTREGVLSAIFSKLIRSFRSLITLGLQTLLIDG